MGSPSSAPRAPLDYDAKAAAKHLTAEAAPLLRAVRARLSELGDWSAAALDAAVRDTAEASGAKLGKLAQPLRVALTGGPASPPIDQTLRLVGRDASLARIDASLARIGGEAPS